MKKSNFPIFFIGGRERGYLWIKQAIMKGEDLVGACIMQEDPHEYERYADKISNLLKENKIPFFLTNSVNKKQYISFIKKTKPKLIIVMGWRTLIPSSLLKLPKFGCVAVHESLLPNYRGFAPINWAVINGEKQTGVTLFYLDEGVDNGDIIAQKKIKIEINDTALDIYNKAVKSSIELLWEFLPLLKKGIAPRIKQKEDLATYVSLRTPDDGLINWKNKTYSIYNLVRGLSYPYPGAFTYLNGKKMIIWKASIPKQKNYVGRIPGRVVKIVKDRGVEILTGDGTLFFEEVEIAFGKRVKATDAIKSIRLTLG